MQIQLIVRSKGGDERMKRGIGTNTVFALLLPTASSIEGSVDGVRYLPARLSFPLHVSSMNGGRDTDRQRNRPHGTYGIDSVAFL